MPTLDELAEAVRMVESSGGSNARPRYESGFQKRYLEGKPQWESLASKYGWPAVSSSYGDYQIMYPVAVELGFTGSPQELAQPDTNRHYFDLKMTKDLAAAGGDVTKALLRYNGGGNPHYAEKVLSFLSRPRQTQETALRSQKRYQTGQ